MQRLKGRSVLFGALAVLACSGDPTGNQSTPTEIVANPDIVFVTQGDSQAVIVSVIDEDGQVLQADFTASNVGSGILVALDPTYQAVTVGNPIRRQTRFFVKGVDLTSSSFTVNALGLSKVVAVTSVPGELNATISDSLPALGDTISITAPTGTFFTDSSVVTFEGAAPVVVSQDATTITFIPFPNIDGPAVVSNVGVASNSALAFSLATPYRVKTDSLTDIGTNVSPTNPVLGATVTLTLPAELRLVPESLVTLTVANSAVLPRDRQLSADSSTITFVPPPNADSFVVVSGVIPRRLAACCAAVVGYGLPLGTTVKVTTPVVTELPSTVSDLAPSANDEVTVTSTDGNFTIDPAAEVMVGAAPATITSRSANSISFVPVPASSGPVTVNGVLIAGFSLALPSSGGSVTVGALTPTSDSDDQLTAPLLSVPPPGEARVFYDLPDFGTTPDHFYKFVITAAGDYTITSDWDIGSDIDQFICGSPVAGDFSNCQFDAATGDHPESATYSLTPGTYFIVLDDFGADAAGARVQITIEQ